MSATKSAWPCPETMLITKKMYEKLLKKYEVQKTLIESLKKQIEELRNN